MKYKEIIAIQEKIVSYREQIRDIISYVDSAGNRKLKHEHVLSAEVAAYILLKKVKLDNIDDNFKDILAIIQNIIVMNKYHSFNQEDIDEYEEYNMLLWSEVLEDRTDKTLIEMNEKLLLFAYLLCKLKYNNFLENVTIDDATNIPVMIYAYYIIHDWAMSLSDEKFEEIIVNTNMAKLLFEVF